MTVHKIIEDFVSDTLTTVFEPDSLSEAESEILRKELLKLAGKIAIFHITEELPAEVRHGCLELLKNPTEQDQTLKTFFSLIPAFEKQIQTDLEVIKEELQKNSNTSIFQSVNLVEQAPWLDQASA